MKEKDILKTLKNMSAKITPTDASFIKNEKRGLNIMKKYTQILIPAILLIIVIVGSLYVYHDQTTSVFIDVNPSIKIDVKKNETIESAHALNKEGKLILKDLKLEHVDLNTGLHAIVGSLYKNKFINEVNNSVLVSIEGDLAKNEMLEKDITTYINEILNGYSIDASILSQVVKTSKELDTQAKNNHITIGKAKLINEILKTNTKRTFEELVNLTISELNLILNDQTRNKELIKTYNVSGEASTKEYITKEKALTIALSDAKVKKSEIIYNHTEFDYDDGLLIYDVEFKTNNLEFEYEINAKNGKIVSNEKDGNDDVVLKEKKTTKASFKKVTQNDAMNIALKHAGITSSELIEKEIDLDYESQYGKKVYEVSFETRDYEYEYDIDPDTGKILKSTKEYND